MVYDSGPNRIEYEDHFLKQNRILSAPPPPLQ